MPDAAFRSEATAEEWFENERMFGAKSDRRRSQAACRSRPLVNSLRTGCPTPPILERDVVLAQPVDNRSIQPDQALAALGLDASRPATAKKPDL